MMEKRWCSLIMNHGDYPGKYLTRHQDLESVGFGQCWCIYTYSCKAGQHLTRHQDLESVGNGDC
jgi:hypothetical protein